MSTRSRPRPARTLRDLADVTGMSVDFFYLEIDAGELRAAKFGREYRVPADEADRYLTAKQFPVPHEWTER